jgi:hypothetical protein
MRHKILDGALLPFALLIMVPLAWTQSPAWHQASPAELGSLLPDRASVNGEHIETEMRTASGIVNRQGQTVAAVVLITSGYSGQAKFSHYLVVQTNVKMGDCVLGPGEYVFGWKKDKADLSVVFYQAQTGTRVGTARAYRLGARSGAELFRIWPPEVRPLIEIGAYGMPYTIETSDPTPGWSDPPMSVQNPRGMSKAGFR